MIEKKLSIIIVNYNSKEFLLNCLVSIKMSSFPKNDLELIVIDNHSKDDGLTDVKKTYPEIQLILNKENLGFARANNQGIRKSTGEYILLLNPDTILERDTLAKMVEFMNKNANVAVATCKVYLPNSELDDASHRGFPTPWRAFCYFTGISALLPKSKFLNGYHLGFADLDKPHEIDSCAGAFMMIRREVADQVSLLDEDYFWYGEDLDFCFRIKKANLKVMFYPGTSITHFKGVSSGIKKISQNISKADMKVRLESTKARFEVMRIFYRKHYINMYPKFITGLVILGISVIELFTTWKLRMLNRI